MHDLTPTNVHTFCKQIRLRAGRIQRIRLQPRGRGQSSAEIRLLAFEQASGRRLKLRLLFTGVDEYRFQRRPGRGVVPLDEVQFGFFDDLVYVNFDALPEDGPPKVMDFRASDCFLAARSVTWEIVPPKPTSGPVV